MADNRTNRRSVLRTIGASTAGLTLGAVGTAAASTDLNVVIHALNSWDRDSATNEVWDALVDYLIRLDNANAIPSFTIYVEDGNLNDKYNIGWSGGDCGEFSKNPRDYLRPSVGEIHHIVTDESDYAGAGATTWEDGSVTWVGTGFGYARYEREDRIRAASIQEVSHALLSHENVDMQTPAGEHHHDAEHALGKITDTDRFDQGPATPMLTYYETEDSNPCRDDPGALGPVGECQNGDHEEWDETYKIEVTDCTVEKVRETSEYYGVI